MAVLNIMHCYKTKPKPREFVIPGMLPGTVGSIVSPGGYGKSMFAVQLAHCVACGTLDMLGLGLLQDGSVAYIGAEDPADILHERLHDIGARLDEAQREICDSRMHIEDVSTETPDLFDVDGAWLAKIEDLCRGRRLVIIDTLRSFHSGDENSNSAMAILIGWLRAIAARTGCAIIFLHHTNKSSAFNNTGDEQQASRGASVLTDNVRWQGFLVGMNDEEAAKYDISESRRGYYVRFGISKKNYGSQFQPVWLERGQGGVLKPCAPETKLGAHHDFSE